MLRSILIVILTVIISSPLFAQASSQASAHATVNIHQVVLKEFLQTTSYTYLNVVEGEDERWLAVPKMDAVVGKTYFYTGGMEMRNFKSSELDTVFYSVFFLNGVLDEEATKPMEIEEKTYFESIPITFIKPVEGGISISNLLNDPKKYANKKIKLKGKVVKYNSGIMGKNWIHLKDGSGANGDAEVTITSDDISKAGQTIIIEGLVTLNKDFGSGYFYEVIVEQGKLIK